MPRQGGFTFRALWARGPSVIEEAALAEMYVQGVSTRKVKAITEELCGHEFSSATGSWRNSLSAVLTPSSTSRKSFSLIPTVARQVFEEAST